jgi:hypothetical protein
MLNIMHTRKTGSQFFMINIEIYSPQLFENPVVLEEAKTIQQAFQFFDDSIADDFFVDVYIDKLKEDNPFCQESYCIEGASKDMVIDFFGKLCSGGLLGLRNK